MRCHSSELFDGGMCVAVHDINPFVQTFKYRDEHRSIKTHSVPLFTYKGWESVANWSDVQAEPEVIALADTA